VTYVLPDSVQRSAFRDVMVACRPQRVAISFDASEDWQTRAAVALAAAGNAWGGSGFILIPHRSGVVHPALLRMARLYDPDYVNEFNFTNEDVRPEGVEQAIMVDENGVQTRALIVSRPVRRIVTRSPKALVDACSIYRTEVLEDRSPHGVGWMRSKALNNMTPLAAMPGQSRESGVYLTVPARIGGTLGLAMAMRCGFILPPQAPFQTEPTLEVSEDDVGYALGIRTATMAMLQKTGDVAVGGRIPIDTRTGWSTTEVGLTNISFEHPMLRASIVVVGSAADDFCLALALMRMSRFVLWLPLDVVETYPAKTDAAIFNFFDDTERRHGKLKVTSTSLSDQEIDDLLGDRFRAANVDAFTPIKIPFIAPEELSLPFPTDILGCVPDFDDKLTLPTLEDDSGGIDLAQVIPYKIPECAQYAPENRPFWEVDVTIYGATTPLGRNSSHLTSADDPDTRGYTNIRSSQAGLSFTAMSDGLTDSSQPIRQSIARPKLRAPSLLEWIQARCASDGYYSAALPSDAGRRAMIATDLYGDRRQLAEGFQTYYRFFRAFVPPIAKKGQPYPEDDGFFIRDLDGGVLSFRAAMRLLPDGSDVPNAVLNVREQLDWMLSRSILRRGLVLRCNACRRVSFFAVDAIGQHNRCSRCNSQTALVQNAWITKTSEPEWFYDLHASIGALIGANGDVPIMAGAYLAKTSRRSFSDVPELDFISARRRPDEVDLIAHCDNQIFVGEVKCMDHIGDTVRKRDDAAAKFIRVAKFLYADQIVLASSGADPWKATSVETLAKAVQSSTWQYGPAPRIRLITGIGTETVVDRDADGQPWKGPHR